MTFIVVICSNILRTTDYHQGCNSADTFYIKIYTPFLSYSDIGCKKCTMRYMSIFGIIAICFFLSYLRMESTENIAHSSNHIYMQNIVVENKLIVAWPTHTKRAPNF